MLRGLGVLLSEQPHCRALQDVGDHTAVFARSGEFLGLFVLGLGFRCRIAGNDGLLHKPCQMFLAQDLAFRVEDIVFGLVLFDPPLRVRNLGPEGIEFFLEQSGSVGRRLLFRLDLIVQVEFRDLVDDLGRLLRIGRGKPYVDEQRRPDAGHLEAL